MAQKKKLQVFVSSTYTDLRDERQAAVEAILTAGNGEDWEKALPKLQEFGLTRYEARSGSFYMVETGTQFLLRLRVELDVAEAEKFV